MAVVTPEDVVRIVSLNHVIEPRSVNHLDVYIHITGCCALVARHIPKIDFYRSIGVIIVADRVTALTANKLVCADSAEQTIIALSTVEDIVAARGVQHIVPNSTKEGIAPVPSDQSIRSAEPCQQAARGQLISLFGASQGGQKIG
nr:hypothetical protein [Microvirga arsenatis]